MCRTANGLFRLPTANGESITTHGFDAPPPPSASSFLPGSTTAVSNASVADIDCVTGSALATQWHTTLIYAYPPGVSSRYAQIAPLLREEAYKASAFLGAESRAVDPSKSQRLPLECDGSGYPVVRSVATTTNTSSDSFGSVVSDLADAGYGGSYGLGVNRYLVFYDGSVGAGVAGTGHLWSDDTKSTNNSNNDDNLVAVEFNWASVPHWDVLLHELGHNMGAVQASAPNDSGAGHCNDGLDIMCYADGGSTSNYSSSVCTYEEFDCGRNDYFNPSPAAGSYLSQHWNAATSENRFLHHVPTVDTVAPSPPNGLQYGTASNTAIPLTWQAASDNVGVAGYRIRVDDGTSSWTVAGTTTQLTYTVGGLAASSPYTLSVTAYDAAGNESSAVQVAANTNASSDVTPPSNPSGLVVGSTTLTTATVAWSPASDDIGVTGYDVYTVGSTARHVGSTNGTSFRVGGLSPGHTYTVGVVAHDDAPNHSSMVQVMLTTPQDNVAPGKGPRPKVVKRAKHSLTVKWGSSSDNVGVTAYRLYKWQGGRWHILATMPSSRHKRTVTHLASHRRYWFVMVALDARGNVGTWSAMGSGTTR